MNSKGECASRADVAESGPPESQNKKVVTYNVTEYLARKYNIKRELKE